MIPGAVVQVEPLALIFHGLQRADFFAVTLSFPIAGVDGRLLAALQLTTIAGRN